MFTLKYLENFVVIAVLIMLKIGVLPYQFSLASPTTLPPDLTTTIPAVITTKIPVETTTTAKIPVETTTTAKIPVETTTTAKIPVETTTTAKIPVETTTTAKTLEESTTTVKIPTETTTAKIPAEPTTTAKIPVETTTTAKIPTEATTTTKVPTITTTVTPIVQTQTNETSSIEDKFSDIPLPSSATSSSLLERVNIDQYLRNKRAMNLQIKCVVYGGTCDLVGKEVKKYIIIGLTGKCTNCSAKMTASVEKVVSYIQENYPQAWNDAIYKYLVEPVFSDKYRSPNSTTPKPDDTHV